MMSVNEMGNEMEAVAERRRIAEIETAFLEEVRQKLDATWRRGEVLRMVDTSNGNAFELSIRLIE